MQRYDIINALIKKFNYKSYLEIGTQMRHACFDKIECKYKVCVDPDPKAKADHIETSDQFFASAKDTSVSFQKPKFDIIFVDGLHHWDQVIKDINNSLEFLSENGSIVVHDCNPKERIHQIVPRISKIWNGDVWIAWIKLRKERDDLDMFVVDSDYGCGVIRRGEQLSPIYMDDKLDLNFGNFQNNRKKWLNLISIDEFLNYLS